MSAIVAVRCAPAAYTAIHAAPTSLVRGGVIVSAEQARGLICLSCATADAPALLAALAVRGVEVLESAQTEPTDEARIAEGPISYLRARTTATSTLPR